ncbi:MAG: hypothetical protein ACI906_001648 [Candidatus Latescibacterota bacterium]|jgi:hypothetical protein
MQLGSATASQYTGVYKIEEPTYDTSALLHLSAQPSPEYFSRHILLSCAQSNPADRRKTRLLP